jgi:hypothetical protein
MASDPRTTKFKDLQPGDIVRTADGGTAKVLSCPSRGMIRGHLGIEMRITGGCLTWSESIPDAIVVLIR